VTKDQILRATRQERRSTLALLRRLEPVQFDAPATPGWRIREVVAHLITMDRATVLGLNLLEVFGSAERLERWNDRQVPKWADRPIPELLLGLDRWGRRLARLFGALPTPLYRLPSPTFLGRAPLGLLISTRIYDEWVHRQDIRRALGMADEEVDVGAAAEVALTAVGIDTLPRVPRRNGVIEISLRETPLPAWRYDLAAGRSGPVDGMSTSPANAVVSASGPAFVMAAAGRDDFAALRVNGALGVEGDLALASAFLEVLRIV
jgi:uncharacterized protein (TIGR03083 family)